MKKTKNRTKLFTLLAFMMLTICACSQKQWYQAVQENRLQTCRQESTAKRQEECREQYQQTFELYQAEREKLKG